MIPATVVTISILSGLRAAIAYRLSISRLAWREGAPDAKSIVTKDREDLYVHSTFIKPGQVRHGLSLQVRPDIISIFYHFAQNVIVRVHNNSLLMKRKIALGPGTHPNRKRQATSNQAR